MAFQQGLSGLNTSSKALDVISNNIANASTVGFKAGQAQFADVYAASLGIGGASQVGIGAALSTVQQQFSQGNISNSNNPLDIAVNGSGFFRVQKNATDQTVSYTRNGQFHLDSNGYIINAQGNNLTGYPIDPTGVTDRSMLKPVQLDTTGVVPRLTGGSDSDPGVKVQMNFDDRDKKSLTSGTPNNLAPWSANTSFPPNNLNTFNYSTSITVYDVKGNSHALSMYFTRVGESAGNAPDKNLWQVHYVMDGQDVTSAVEPATSGNSNASGVPMIEFGSDGKIKTSSYGQTNGFSIPPDRTEVQPGGIANTGTGAAPLYMFYPTMPASAAAAATLNITYFPAAGGAAVTAPASAIGGVTITPEGNVDLTGAVGVIDFAKSVSVEYTPDQSLLGTDYKFNIDVVELEAFTNASGGTPFKDLFRNPEKPTVLTIPIDFTNSTLFGSGYDVNKLTQDGYPYGRLSGVSVSPDGVLQGNYSNGQTKKIAQIVLVDFISPTGLASLGNNQWAETAASGQPLVGDPGTGNRGVLQSSRVEDANVDLTQELVNMITQQRNYQANAQSIKTQDQIMQTLVNLR